MFIDIRERIFSNQYMKMIESITGYFILVLISISFLLSDFRHGAFTFADYILIGVFLLLVITLRIRLSLNQIGILSGLGVMLLINGLIQMRYSDITTQSVLVTQSVKLLFYAGNMVLIFNFIKEDKLEKTFLNTNNYIALVSIVIGIYITIALYSNGRLPFEFFWEFTRSHPTSYEFQGNPNIIRTRSLFSEPAHFGYYLLVILGANLFNKQSYRPNIAIISVLSLGVLSTLSYSMVVGLILTMIMYLVITFKGRRLEWRNSYYWLFGFFSVLIVAFWNFISVTIIDRTRRIFSGQDPSTTNRLLESWQYVSSDTILIGNGIGHTPVITNNFAYILSDFGLMGFIPALVGTGFLFYLNIPFAVLVVLLNIFRGGYLSAPFWIVLLIFFLYSFKENDRERRE